MRWWWTGAVFVQCGITIWCMITHDEETMKFASVMTMLSLIMGMLES